MTMPKGTALPILILSMTVAACQPGNPSAVSPSVASSASPSASPVASRLLISDTHLPASDSGAFVLFQIAGDDRLRGISWDGRQTGIFDARIGPAALWSSQSPDSLRFVAGRVVYDRAGRSLGALPWPGKESAEATWSTDAKALCKAVPDWATTGAPMHLEVARPGQPARTIVRGFA